MSGSKLYLCLLLMCSVLSLSIRCLHRAIGSLQGLKERVGWNEEHIVALEALVAPLPAPSRYGPFDINNLDNIRCGGKKCFAQFKSNTKEGFVFPHLEAETFFELGDLAQSFNETYAFGRRLDHDYGIPSMFLGPPRYLTETDENWRRDVNKILLEMQVAIPTNRSLLIQKVKSIPTPNLLFQQWKGHVARNMTGFVDFLKTNTIDDKRQFASNLLGGLNTTRRVLDSYEYRCLNYDFQMIIDYQGKVHLIDLDQCFESKWSKDPSQEAISNRTILLNTFENCFLSALRTYNVSVARKHRKIRPFRSCKWL